VEHPPLRLFRIVILTGDTFVGAASRSARDSFVIIAIFLLWLVVRGCRALVLPGSTLADWLAGWLACWLASRKERLIAFIVELLNIFITVVVEALNVYVAVIIEWLGVGLYLGRWPPAWVVGGALTLGGRRLLNERDSMLFVFSIHNENSFEQNLTQRRRMGRDGDRVGCRSAGRKALPNITDKFPTGRDFHEFCLSRAKVCAQQAPVARLLGIGANFDGLSAIFSHLHHTPHSLPLTTSSYPPGLAHPTIRAMPPKTHEEAYEAASELFDVDPEQAIAAAKSNLQVGYISWYWIIENALLIACAEGNWEEAEYWRLFAEDMYSRTMFKVCRSIDNVRDTH